MTWTWPLQCSVCDRKLPDYPGSFGAIRKFDIHSGVDLYCVLGTFVRAAEDGLVVNIENFTGPSCDPPTPWWNDTKALLVEGSSGVIVYGEMTPSVQIGDQIKQGQIIGMVDVPVLKKYKGRPMVMLHVELQKHGERSKSTCWWPLNEPKPEQLLDPTELLIEAQKYV